MYQSPVFTHRVYTGTTYSQMEDAANNIGVQQARARWTAEETFILYDAICKGMSIRQICAARILPYPMPTVKAKIQEV